MMNKSKIDWCDFSWNPVTGCRMGCPYCYAAKQSQRFSGDVRLNKMSPQMQHDSDDRYILDAPFMNNAKGRVIPCPAGFEPTLHRYRLPMPAQKKKPANIFTCSMADLMAPWTPAKWIVDVYDACEAAPWHNYLFLTKYPQRYEQLDTLALLPHLENFWYGATITRSVELDRMRYFPQGVNRFISIEPILEPIDFDSRPPVDWIIVGAETGNRREKVKPEKRWIESIIKTARSAGIPVLMKHSKELEKIWGKKLIQEFPAGLTRPADIPIPHCSECQHHKAEERHYDSVKDVTMMNHVCTHGTVHKRIPGRYARTSPSWCPIRKGGESEK